MEHDTTTELSFNAFLLDVLCTVLAFLAAFWLRRFLPDEGTVDLYSHLFLIPLLLSLTIGSLSWFGGYRGPHETTFATYLWAICKAMFVTVGVLLALLFFLKIEYVSRFVVLIFAALEFCVLVLNRACAIRYFKEQVKSGRNRLRVLIVGTKKRAQELVQALQRQVAWGCTWSASSTRTPPAWGRRSAAYR